MKDIYERFMQNRFLFEELVKRDFKQKYKRTVLGMLWSIFSPLCQLVVLNMVFSNFFGKNVEHYAIYLFCGNLLFAYYKESTNGGMLALMANASIFTKINVSKYMFVLSKNVSAFINFLLTLILFFMFVLIDDIAIKFNFITLLYPIITLVMINIGVGMILSALYIFFRDIVHLYDVFSMLLMYMSAIFYTVDIIPEEYRWMFYLNPIYCCIEYFRIVVLQGNLPDIKLHLLCAFYAFTIMGIGALIYKKYNYKFIYYI